MIESFVLSIPTNVCLTRHTMKMLSMLQSHCRLKHGNNFLYFIFYIDIFRTLSMLISQKLLSLSCSLLYILRELNCLTRSAKIVFSKEILNIKNSLNWINKVVQGSKILFYVLEYWLLVLFYIPCQLSQQYVYLFTSELWRLIWGLV